MRSKLVHLTGPDEKAPHEIAISEGESRRVQPRPETDKQMLETLSVVQTDPICDQSSSVSELARFAAFESATQRSSRLEILR